MAWRIETHVIRGEIDNRIRGRITGRLWVLGRPAPIEVELKGNPSRDIAGRRLTFQNPAPQPGLAASFTARQVGVVGDFTASKRVRQPAADGNRGPGTPLANGVCFEWFSGANGRVIIESAGFQVSVGSDAAWEMSAAEEADLRRNNADAMNRFFESLGILSPEPDADTPSGTTSEDEAEELGDETWVDDESWRGDEPLTEAEADELIDDADRLADRLLAHLEAAGEDADLESIIEEELERRHGDDEVERATGEREPLPITWIEEIQRAADQLSRDVDYKAELENRHPLSEWSRDLALRIMAEAEQEAWAPDDADESHPVMNLIRTVTRAGGKFAGALDGRVWPPSLDECGVCIAWLKRARSFLNEAEASAEYCYEGDIFSRRTANRIVREIEQLGSETDTLIEQLRDRLNRKLE